MPVNCHLSSIPQAGRVCQSDLPRYALACHRRPLGAGSKRWIKLVEIAQSRRNEPRSSSDTEPASWSARLTTICMRAIRPPLNPPVATPNRDRHVGRPDIARPPRISVVGPVAARRSVPNCCPSGPGADGVRCGVLLVATRQGGATRVDQARLTPPQVQKHLRPHTGADVAPRGPVAGPISPSGLLRLQRAAGNRAAALAVQRDDKNAHRSDWSRTGSKVTPTRSSPSRTSRRSPTSTG